METRTNLKVGQASSPDIIMTDGASVHKPNLFLLFFYQVGIVLLLFMRIQIIESPFSRGQVSNKE